MRKVWSYALLVLALLLALSLMACESGGGNDNETDAITTEGATTAAPEAEGTTAPEGDVTTAPEGDVTTEPEGDATTSPEGENTEPETDPIPTDGVYSWSNPIRSTKGTSPLRDPFILKVGDAWYMTGTLPPYGLSEEASRTKGVPLYKSTDLDKWELVDVIVKTPAESEGKWYSERFWAAEIFAHNDKFYVTVNCCDVDGSNHGFLFAVADNIEGPYTIMNPDAPLALGNDAHLFVDTDGQTYVFASNIMYAKIDLDTLTLLSDWQYPVTPIEGSDAWNGLREGVEFEGPYVLTIGGKYYMFYSTWARGYEIGLATADSITGEWTMYADPMYGGINQGSCDYYGGIYEEGYYENQDKYRECGHNSVFEGPDGELWIAAHVFPAGYTTTPVLVIDRLVLDEERGILCLDTATGQTINGPTYGPQSVTYDPQNNEANPLHALDVWKYADQGKGCTLPSKVDILLENGFRRTVPVIWSKLPDTSVPGEYTIDGTATYKGTKYPVTAHITVQRITSADCDFDNVAVGTAGLGENFDRIFALTFQMYEAIGRGPVAIVEEGANRFMRCTAYLVAKMTVSLTDSYTASLDWRCLDDETAGGVAERLGGIILHGGDETLLPHYEEESKIAEKCIGGSGLLIMPDENGFRIVVKTYDASIQAVTHSETFISYANGLDFTTISVVEDDGVMTVYAGDTLLFTAEMSDKGGYDGASYEYYRSVTVKGADGETLIQVQNAFLTVESAFHIVSRGWTAFDVDNLHFEIN